MFLVVVPTVGGLSFAGSFLSGTSQLSTLAGLTFCTFMFSCVLKHFRFTIFVGIDKTHVRCCFVNTCFISALVGKSYFTNLSLEIGRIFVDNETSSNTGLISDGYAKMGLIGVIIVCMLFLLTLRIIDSLSPRFFCHVLP